MKRVVFLCSVLSVLVIGCTKNSTNFVGTLPGGGSPATPVIVADISPIINQPYDAVLDGSSAFNVNEVVVIKVYTTVFNDEILSGSVNFTDAMNKDVILSTIDFPTIEGNPLISSGVDNSSGYLQPYYLISLPLGSELEGKNVGLSVNFKGSNTEGTSTLISAFQVIQ